jgi:hypothetical protein
MPMHGKMPSFSNVSLLGSFNTACLILLMRNVIWHVKLVKFFSLVLTFSILNNWNEQKFVICLICSFSATFFSLRPSQYFDKVCLLNFRIDLNGKFSSKSLILLVKSFNSANELFGPPEFHKNHVCRKLQVGLEISLDCNKERSCLLNFIWNLLSWNLLRNFDFLQVYRF